MDFDFDMDGDGLYSVSLREVADSAGVPLWGVGTPPGEVGAEWDGASVVGDRLTSVLAYDVDYFPSADVSAARMHVMIDTLVIHACCHDLP